MNGFPECLPGGPQIPLGLACPAMGFGWSPAGGRSTEAGTWGRQPWFQKLTLVNASWSWVNMDVGAPGDSGGGC